MAKKKLRVRVHQPKERWQIPPFPGREGQEGVLVAIDRDCNPAPPYCHWGRVRFEDGEELTGPTDVLVPLDTSMVPDTHMGNQRLINAWVFSVAAREAWVWEENAKAYLQEWGTPMEDDRNFEIGRTG